MLAVGFYSRERKSRTLEADCFYMLECKNRKFTGKI